MGTSMASPHVAGVAALIVGAGRAQAGRGRAAPARAPRASPRGPRQSAAGRARRRPLRRRPRRRRRGPAQGPDGQGAGELGLGGRWPCSASRVCAGAARHRHARAGLSSRRWSLGCVAACSSCLSCSGACPPRSRSSSALSARLRCRPPSRWARCSATRCSAAPSRRSGLIVLLYGVRRLRPALAGFGLRRRWRPAVRGRQRHRRRPLRARPPRPLLARPSTPRSASCSAARSCASSRRRREGGSEAQPRSAAAFELGQDELGDGLERVEHADAAGGARPRTRGPWSGSGRSRSSSIGAALGRSRLLYWTTYGSLSRS